MHTCMVHTEMLRESTTAFSGIRRIVQLHVSSLFEHEFVGVVYRLGGKGQYVLYSPFSLKLSYIYITSIALALWSIGSMHHFVMQTQTGYEPKFQCGNQ